MDPMFLIMIVFLILGGSVGGAAIYYDVTVTTPNAEAEFEEMKKYSCDQMKSKLNSSFWSPENSQYARDVIDMCNEVDKAIKAKITEKASLLGKEVFRIQSDTVDVYAKTSSSTTGFAVGIGILERQFDVDDVVEYETIIRETIGDNVDIEFFPLEFCITDMECSQQKNLKTIKERLGKDFEENTDCVLLPPVDNMFTISCNTEMQQ